MSQVDAFQKDDGLMEYVPRHIKPLASHVAGTGVAPTARRDVFDKLDEGAGLPVSDLALGVAEYGLPGMGPLGYVAGVPFSWIVADRTAQRKMTELTETFRHEIASQMHVTPDVVTPQLMLMAAEQNEGLGQAVRSVFKEKERHPMINGFGIGGMAAGMGTAAAIASGPPGWIAGGIAALAGSFAGEFVGKKVVGNSEKYDPMTYLKKIHEKRSNRQAITALDVFELRVAQNAKLGEAVEFKYDKPFFDLDNDDKLAVMQSYGGLAACCQQDAAKCARPEANINSLMFGCISEPVAEFSQLRETVETGAGMWANRVGGPNANQGRYSDMVRQQQLDAMQPRELV